MEPMKSASLTLSPNSPSFATFSSENIADVAARVVKELNLSHEDPYDDEFYSSLCSNDAFCKNDNDGEIIRKSGNEDEDKIKDKDEDEDEEEEDEESEFEFAVLGGEDNSSPISADEIFSNGQIKPMFPIFNTDLVYGYRGATRNDGVSRKLFEERESSSSRSRNDGVSCSSSEADDLEGVPPGTYCVWTPKKKEEVMMMKKKSKSTGSSKRWRFRDLLYRSNSDGKDTFVFLTPSPPNNNNNNKVTAGKKLVTIGGKKKSGVNGNGNGGNANGGRKKSYLPYRQDLVGFFANVNGISRTVRPF
ncbi:Replicase polyprotein 1a [Bienertia sinuspersici]